MKKFLSLVLALIMTMSLVTISAGATEYRDLTDKDEIQYEEAVAVLNRIGVITGYEDGSFRPETELTRGAAAKIIVSLMIGPDAASALPNNASPYPDVPAGHTFAGVIGYCKTAGYISGYGDGTFKPANPLTGFAFAKMLLGAVGYKSNIEGFVDTGWTMNVARIGNVAGLFDRISFDGAKAVTRDEACQLALNTLKATMVDYGNANTVVSSSGEVLTVQGSKAQYVTSNNRDINANINRRVISATNNELTLEFGEEHFKDLRLEHDRFDPAYDVYGHPSNEWSYKKVTIGTFPLAADFTFTKQISHIEDTAATKEKALGLRGYDTYSTDHSVSYSSWSTPGTTQYNTASPFANATQIHINGWNARVYNDDYKQGNVPAGVVKDGDGTVFTYDASKIGASNKEEAPSLSEIADLTDNGVTVEVYVCPVDADFITDVVVTRTQLMEVDRVASDYVELDTVSSDSKDETLTEIAGYNDFALHYEVSSVKDNNYDAYNVLKELKSGDEVAIIPYTTDDGKTWEVGEAYVPETVSGALTNVDIYNTNSKADGNAIAITVGGTTYPIAQWNKDMRKITGYMIKASKKDVTLLLDKTGNALLAKDVGSTDAWIVVGDYYQAAGASGRVGWFVHGWTIKGDEVDLDLGTIRGAAEKYAPGELVQYRVAEEGNGEYELNKPNFNGRSVLKNGQLGWTEPKLQDGWEDDNHTVPTLTGEGIYNVAQFARQTGSPDMKYNIKSVNSLVPLEFYDTTKNGGANKGQVTGAGIEHYDYAKADRVTEVGKDSDDCGVLTGASSATGTPAYKGTAGADESFDTWTYRTAPYDGVKFIFVGFDPANGEVDTISFLDGVQNVGYDELKQINRWWKNVGTNDDSFVASPAEAYVDKNGKVKAVVIKSDSAEASLKDLIIITDNKGANTSTKGGAEAPTSGTYYTRQYVSGEDGFKEEKTGYFDRMLSVGTVVTGRLQSDGVFKTRTFHANEYTNRNPDGIYVKGIDALTTLNGKDSDTEFYIGAKANGVVQHLGTGVKGGDNGLLTDDGKMYILSGIDVMGIDNPTDTHGLIKVDSTTQWIDLRDGRPGDIDELSDLLERDRTQVQLKLILNGNKDSDGFRHAYAVMILAAGPKSDDAEKPVVNITAGVGGVGITGDKLTVDETKNPVEWTVKAAPGSKVNLAAVPTKTLDKYGVLSYNWQNNYGISGDKQSIEVTAPAAGEKVELTLTVTNRDTTKKDKITETYTVKVFVEGEGAGDSNVPSGATYTLTLKGLLAGTANGGDQFKVYAKAPGATEYTRVTMKSDSWKDLLLADNTTVKIEQYEIGQGYDVRLISAANTNDTALDAAGAGTYTVDGLSVTVTGAASGTNDQIDFNLSKDATLYLKTKNTFDGTPTKQYSIKSEGGVAGTFAYTDSTKGTVELAANKTILISGAGTFTVSDTGVGNSVLKDVKKDTAAAGNTIAIAGTANVTLYSANKVTVAGTNAQVSGTGVAAIKATNATPVAAYVATGVELTVAENATTALGGFLKFDNEDTKAGAKMTGTTFTMNDEKDVYVYGAHKVELDGVTATYGTSSAVSDGDYVAEGTALTLAAANSYEVVVTIAAANDVVGVSAGTAATISTATSFASFTKVDGSALDDTATVQAMNEILEGSGTKITLNSTNKIVGVKAGTKLIVLGKNENTTVKVNGKSDAADHTDFKILSASAGNGSGTLPKTVVEVRTTALILTQA